MVVKNDQFRDFLLEQNLSWQLSAQNYKGLDKVEGRDFLINGFRIKVQFNPERIRSSSAKVDHVSIAARKCFLCSENRPAEQKSLDFSNGFLLLVNPFPIFNRHFTIPFAEHTPQRLVPNLAPMLETALQMEGYSLFYNGPECGASAPDHLHFQAGENGFMPLESEFEELKLMHENLLYQSTHIRIWAFDDYLRKMISIRTNNLDKGIRAITHICTRFREIQPDKVEPMMNLICYYQSGNWLIHLFPRKLHRPWQFFEEGDQNLMISPASVDFGGVLITPRREDFEKITAADIVDIFSQVTLDETGFTMLKESIVDYK